MKILNDFDIEYSSSGLRDLRSNCSYITSGFDYDLGVHSEWREDLVLSVLDVFEGIASAYLRDTEQTRDRIFLKALLKICAQITFTSSGHFENRKELFRQFCEACNLGDINDPEELTVVLAESETPRIIGRKIQAIFDSFLSFTLPEFSAHNYYLREELKYSQLGIDVSDVGIEWAYIQFFDEFIFDPKSFADFSFHALPVKDKLSFIFSGFIFPQEWFARGDFWWIENALLQEDNLSTAKLIFTLKINEDGKSYLRSTSNDHVVDLEPRFAKIITALRNSAMTTKELMRAKIVATSASFDSAKSQLNKKIERTFGIKSFIAKADRDNGRQNEVGCHKLDPEIFLILSKQGNTL